MGRTCLVESISKAPLRVDVEEKRCRNVSQRGRGNDAVHERTERASEGKHGKTLNARAVAGGAPRIGRTLSIATLLSFDRQGAADAT